MYGMMRVRWRTVDNPSGLPIDSLLKSSVQGGHTDVHALAVAGDRELSVMVWNYTDDAVPGESVNMTILLRNLPAGAKRFRRYRIAEEHSNAYEVWKKMGSPPSPE